MSEIHLCKDCKHCTLVGLDEDEINERPSIPECLVKVSYIHGGRASCYIERTTPLCDRYEALFHE